jgi:Uma2 family endonuclease
LRWEFDGLGPVAMTGVTEAHALIQAALLIAVGRRLDRRPCRIVGSDLKLLTDGRIRYPDAMIICSPVQRDRKVVPDPVVVFEILSPGTASSDMIQKNAEYKATQSIQRYVVLEQTSAAGLAFMRKGDDWVTEVLTGPDAVLHLPEVGIEFPLAELYRDIDFAADGEARAEA